MKKAKVKIPAKLNLSLDVVGNSGGYHQLNSIVCSVNLYDEVSVKVRNDYDITLKEKGISCGCEPIKNNAYKTAEKFMVEYGVLGADITINKSIFVGGGLGGSSADIAGVINCVQKIYGLTDEECLNLANRQGSDSGYMLKGGLALLEGRGDKITSLGKLNKTYMLLVRNDTTVLAKSVFKEFDDRAESFKPCSKQAIEKLTSGDTLGFFKALKNDLTASAVKYCKEIESAVKGLKTAGALTALMTGSGPTVFGVFENKKMRDTAYKKLKAVYGDRLVKVNTL
jgi:4-diphosphocytidyl-2-C-methyl-D-erythritol kinase